MNARKKNDREKEQKKSEAANTKKRFDFVMKFPC